MEKKRTLYSLESDIRRILEDNDFVSTCDERGKQWYINLVSDLAIYIQQELDKAREEGRREGVYNTLLEINRIKSLKVDDYIIEPKTEMPIKITKI